MGEGCAPDAWVCKVSYMVSLTNGVEQKGQEMPRGCVREGMGFVTIF